MKKYITICLITLPAILLASSSSEVKDYDFFHRLFNFIVFFGILFYLLKNFVRNAYNNRINNIASKLEAIQASLRESKEKKVNSYKRLEDARAEAISIIERAKKEIGIEKVKIEESTEEEIKNLSTSYENKKEFEKKKAVRAVVDNIIDETFNDNSVKLSQKDLIEVINKKVS